jgi:hypothetical protein
MEARARAGTGIGLAELRGVVKKLKIRAELRL